MISCEKIHFTVLYVEDEEEIREYFARYLKRYIDVLYTAKDGAEALELYHQHKPDIIISDINMPRMSGLEFAKAVKKDNKDQSIIFTTARTEVEFFLASIELNIDGYILKPVIFGQFKELLFKTANKLEAQKMRQKIKDMHNYSQKQQHLAKEKQLNMIVNQLEDDKDFAVDIIYKASDILSGDSYSIFKKEDGTIILFLIDGQGHGILPSLTVFAAINAIKQGVNHSQDLKSISKRFVEDVRDILSDGEQLAFSIISISPDKKAIDYSIGGMYPFLLKDAGEIKEATTNNLPLLSFSDEINTTRVDLKNFEGLLLFSDGIVEDIEAHFENSNMEKFLLDEEHFFQFKKDLEKEENLADDTTLILLTQKSS